MENIFYISLGVFKLRFHFALFFEWKEHMFVSIQIQMVFEPCHAISNSQILNFYAFVTVKNWSNH